jgi:uncharacterized protein YkwD
MEMPVRIGRASLRGALVALCLLVTLPAVASAGTARCANAAVVPNAGTLDEARHATLCLVNRERTKRGLPKLRTNRALQASARAYARDMVRRSFFDHVTPGGETLTQRIRDNTRYLAGALRWQIGENLAWGTGSRATPAQIVSGWMHSPGHRANIVNRGFREMGMGIALGIPVAGTASASSSGAATYTNHFGRRG